MENDFVLIFSTTDNHLCKKARALLKKNKIRAEVVIREDSNEFISQTGIFVSVNDVTNAKSILKELNFE